MPFTPLWHWKDVPPSFCLISKFWIIFLTAVPLTSALGCHPGQAASGPGSGMVWGRATVCREFGSRRATWVGPHAERPRFPGPLLRRTRGPDPSSKATLWAFPGENARSWEALGEARPGQSSLSAGALRYRAWVQSWCSAALALTGAHQMPPYRH